MDEGGIERMMGEEGMPKEIYEAALYGDWEAIEKKAAAGSDDEHNNVVKKKTLVGNNILHLAIRSSKLNFAKKAVKRYPHLMGEANMDGNTPFHLAAMLDEEIFAFVYENYVEEVWEKELLEDDDPRWPLLLRKKNSMGNTPLHVAVIHRNFVNAEALAKKDPNNWVKNFDGNTPLHIAAAISDSYRDESYKFVQKFCNILTTDPSPLLRMQNNVMGNTALHLAIIHSRIDIAITLLMADPTLASVLNYSAESPLHLAIQHFPYDHDKLMYYGVKEECIRVMEGKTTEGYHDVGSEVSFVKMIVLLLQKASYVAGWQDKTGLTPLHKAASIRKALNLDIIEFMSERCPQSVEVCDTYGKTILHHLINKTRFPHDILNFVQKPRVNCIRNLQDHEGNTILHSAVIHQDLNMLQLFEDFDYKKASDVIRNKQGWTANELFRQSNLKEVQERAKEESMDELEKVCDAIKNDNEDAIIEIVRNSGLGIFKQKDSKGRNLLHLLFYILETRDPDHSDEYYDLLNYVAKWIYDYNQLLEQTDIYGDTPLHVVARLKPVFSIEVLRILKNKVMSWVPILQNFKGNTAAHEAVIAGNHHTVLEFLVQCNEESTSLANENNETLLDLLAIHPMRDISDDILHTIIRKNKQANLPILDKDGITPVTKAIQAGNVEFAARLVSSCPSLASMKDAKGRTFWHMLVSEPPIESLDLKKFSFDEKVALNQLEQKDNDGMTALHLAIEHSRFDLAEAFLGLHENHTTGLGSAPIFLKKLLHIPNHNGITPADIIGKLTYVPPTFEEFIGKVSTMIGIRSIWGIPSTEMKEYVNTMGVIAALITTITFTAAFTVPGGLDQEKGNPLLIQNPSFQAFIVFDILAMCLSMMVLFCLLWIMATGKKSNAVVLLDFSIILLLASFYTTLLTFMTGLYATTYLVKRWVAILGLVTCSLLLLLMHKFLVRKFIIPFGKIVLIYFNKACMIVKKLAKKLLRQIIKLCCCRRRSSSSELPISSIEMMNSTNSNDDDPATT